MKFIDFIRLSDRDLGKYIRSFGYLTCTQFPHDFNEFLKSINVDTSDVKLGYCYFYPSSDFGTTINFTYEGIPCAVILTGKGRCTMSIYYADNSDTSLFEKQNYLWDDRDSYAWENYSLPTNTFGVKFDFDKNEMFDYFIKEAKKIKALCEEVITFFEDYPEYHRLALKYFDFDFSKGKDFSAFCGFNYLLPRFYTFVNAKYNLRKYLNTDMSYDNLFILYKAWQKMPEKYECIKYLFNFWTKPDDEITFDLLKHAIDDNSYDPEFEKPKYSDYMYDMNIEYWKAKQEFKNKFFDEHPNVDPKRIDEYFNGKPDYFDHWRIPEELKYKFK